MDVLGLDYNFITLCDYEWTFSSSLDFICKIKKRKEK